jgi:hypothetical protein
MSDMKRVLDAMRSDEWLRTQWIARVAFGLGSAQGPKPHEYGAMRHILCWPAASGRVEQRDDLKQREGDIGGVPVRFAIPRQELRLTP